MDFGLKRYVLIRNKNDKYQNLGRSVLKKEFGQELFALDFGLMLI